MLGDVMAGYSRLMKYSDSSHFWSRQNVNLQQKNPGWLGYIGDYTTQVYRDDIKPL